jgi:hypothetical protein
MEHRNFRVFDPKSQILNHVVMGCFIEYVTKGSVRTISALKKSVIWSFMIYLYNHYCVSNIFFVRYRQKAHTRGGDFRVLVSLQLYIL